MFSMLTNLTKAVVSLAVTPVTAVVDLTMLPKDAVDHGEAFGRTRDALKNAGECLKEAVKPEK